MIRALNRSESQPSKSSAEEPAMKTTLSVVTLIIASVFAVVGGRSSPAQEKQDKYALQIPGKPFPDGSKIVKLEWKLKKITDPPFSASTPDTVPGDLTEVEFIVKDSKKFSDSHGWGYAMFDYDAASGTFAPATTASKPPVGHDAKCGAACHTLAASKDYIFTAYPKR